MKTNLRERLTGYQCFIRPKDHFAPEFSFMTYEAHINALFCMIIFYIPNPTQYLNLTTTLLTIKKPHLRV